MYHDNNIDKLPSSRCHHHTQSVSTELGLKFYLSIVCKILHNIKQFHISKLIAAFEIQANVCMRNAMRHTAKIRM